MIHENCFPIVLNESNLSSCSKGRGENTHSKTIRQVQGKNLTGVMPVKGHFARQKHTPNKNVRQVTYKVYIFPFHVKGP